MRRREFITILAGATAYPFAVSAQQGPQMRRVGVLVGGAETDPEMATRVATFVQSLQHSGWIVGQNIAIEYRWAGDNNDSIRKSAAELVALNPDVILSHTSVGLESLLRASRTIPIVFTVVGDPVGAGYVDSLAHPGGNATGFTVLDYSIGGKWLELLKEIAPRTTRAAVLRDSGVSLGPALLSSIQTVAPSFGVEVRPVDTRDAKELERAITLFAQGAGGGLIVTGSAWVIGHRKLIIELAARYRLPAIYYATPFVADGGLISYGPDYVDQFRLAASYVDRILKGEKPAELPVQNPAKFELVINLKTAKSLDLTVSTSLLARANQIIE
ncbi:MAG TPA: ABC transporter substrate-binding protein [Pseudolabrys sp.]|nr:ABC transporter substrate-binding protein [Pseudolabrys sp.]